VRPARTAFRWLVASLAIALATPVMSGPVVRASDYDAYWLWAGVRARPDVDAANTVYLMQGEIAPDREGRVRLMARGGVDPGAHRQALWIVYRARSLDWPDDVVAGVVRRLEAWRAAPGPTVGVQVDFDASTRGLANYATFLRGLRRALPEGCELSVTGLMDWASQGEPEDLDALKGAVDEVVFQTYRGSETVRDIDAYLERLRRVRIPFRLGLVEGGAWSQSADLASNPLFKGYVVFLRN